MSRRPKERDLARAEEIASGRMRTEQPTIGGAKVELIDRFRRMSERGETDCDGLQAQGINPPSPTTDEQRAWALNWETLEVERVRQAQQRMVDRATGKLGYVSPLPEHVAATHAHDLRQVETAKTMLRVARKTRRHLEAM